MPQIDIDWFRETIRKSPYKHQAGLARAMGMAQAQLNMKMNGRRPLQLHEVNQLALLLGVTVADILAHSGVGVGPVEPVPFVEKTCLTCGKVFMEKRHRQVTCGEVECWKAQRKKRKTRRT